MPNDTQPFPAVTPDNSAWFHAIWNWLTSIYPHIIQFLHNTYGIIVAISLVMSLIFFIGIIYCVEGLKRIRNAEEALLNAKVVPAFETVDNGDRASAHRWANIQKHIDSDNPNDWKQSIMEADIILDDLLTKMGYNGESIGEKLKRVVKGDMKSLDEAWEAHKVRNQIAHEGSDFALNHHEAKNVIGMYRKVFQEFYFI